MQSESPIKAGSALASLGFSAEELAALAKQGFVCAEPCGFGRMRYKLRFRLGTRQHVRCLGRDSQFVERVRSELAQVQVPTRLQQELGRLVQVAKHKLRATKRQLEPLLESTGFVFHGMAVRRPRIDTRRQTALIAREEGEI